MTTRMSKDAMRLLRVMNERFGSYDLYEAAAYIHYLSGHIVKGREG